MGRSRAAILNMVITLIYQVCTVIFGLIVPRYFLLEYGADIHGLTSTITNILNYVVLLNAGLLTASVQALYKPLSTEDYTEVNAIINAVKKYYYKVGLSYTVVTLLLSFLLPLFVSGEIDGVTVFSLMLVMGLSNIFDSFLGAKYRVLVQADQKYWLMGMLNTSFLIIRGILQLTFIYFHLSIVMVQLVPVLMTILTYFLLKLFAYRNYKYLNRNVKPDFQALNQRRSALLHQIAGVVVNNTDTLLLSVFSNLTVVSIYTVYQMVFTHLYSLVTSVFSTSNVASFGHMLVTDPLEKVRKVFDVYEAVFFFVISCILITCGVLIGPFVKIYTDGVQGIVYYDFQLVFLFMTIAVLNNARVPCGMMINAAGHYKKTQYRAVAEAVINLSVSLLLVGKFGIYGVLIGTVVSFLYRTADIIIYTNRHILKQSFWKSIRRMVRMVLSIAVVWSTANFLLNWEIQSWTEWICLGVVAFCAAVLFSSAIWLVVERQTCLQAVSFIKARLGRRK